jgi:hypothetical protein
VRRIDTHGWGAAVHKRRINCFIHQVNCMLACNVPGEEYFGKPRVATSHDGGLMESL